MKKALFCCAIIVPFLVSAGITTGPIGTEWSQSLIQSATLDDALAVLGITTNGIIGSVDTNQFTLEDNKLAIKSGVSLTNTIQRWGEGTILQDFAGLDGLGLSVMYNNNTFLSFFTNETLHIGARTTFFDEVDPSCGNVDIGGSLTVNGTATFNVPVIVSEPSATNHAATKAYVDSITGGPGLTNVSETAELVTIETNLQVNGVVTNNAVFRGLTVMPPTDDSAITHDLVTLTNPVDGSVRKFGFDENGRFYCSGPLAFGEDTTKVATLDALGEFGIVCNEMIGGKGLISPISTNDVTDPTYNMEASSVITVNATNNDVAVVVKMDRIQPAPGWTGRFLIIRSDNSTNQVTVEPSGAWSGGEFVYGLIDGKESVSIPPLCSLEVITKDGVNLVSSLDKKGCLPTWMDVTAGAFVLGSGVATPVKVDAYPGAPYKVYAFDTADAAYFTLQTQHKLAVTNVWFPVLTYDRHLHAKLTAKPTTGQSNITVALDYRLAVPNGTFESLVSITNTTTLTATNTHYLVDWGAITNNALSGASSVIIEGGIRRIAGGAGDITDNVVCFESLDFHFPFEVPLGSQNRLGD